MSMVEFFLGLGRQVKGQLLVRAWDMNLTLLNWNLVSELKTATPVIKTRKATAQNNSKPVYVMGQSLNHKLFIGICAKEELTQQQAWALSCLWGWLALDLSLGTWSWKLPPSPRNEASFGHSHGQLHRDVWVPSLITQGPPATSSSLHQLPRLQETLVHSTIWFLSSCHISCVCHLLCCKCSSVEMRDMFFMLLHS